MKQTFPHGRSKTVAVEVKRKRTYAAGRRRQDAEVAERSLRSAPPSSAAEDSAHLSNLTAGRSARTRLKALEGGARAPTKMRRARRPKKRAPRAEEAAQAAEEEARRQAAEARGEV